MSQWTSLRGLSMAESEHFVSLEQAIVLIRSVEEGHAFLRALWTRQEIPKLRHRWEGLQRVASGANQSELRLKVGFGKIPAGRCVEAYRTNRKIIETIISSAGAGKS